MVALRRISVTRLPCAGAVVYCQLLQVVNQLRDLRRPQRGSGETDIGTTPSVRASGAVSEYNLCACSQLSSIPFRGCVANGPMSQQCQSRLRVCNPVKQVSVHLRTWRRIYFSGDYCSVERGSTGELLVRMAPKTRAATLPMASLRVPASASRPFGAGRSERPPPF